MSDVYGHFTNYEIVTEFTKTLFYGILFEDFHPKYLYLTKQTVNFEQLPRNLMNSNQIPTIELVEIILTCACDHAHRPASVSVSVRNQKITQKYAEELLMIDCQRYAFRWSCYQLIAAFKSEPLTFEIRVYIS